MVRSLPYDSEVMALAFSKHKLESIDEFGQTLDIVNSITSGYLPG
jgi:hypothetical protein